MSSVDYRKKDLFRFQHQINDLENNRFDVLGHDDFIKDLGDYLLQLYQLNHYAVTIRVLEKIGECVSNIDFVHRERALLILLEFAEYVEKEDGEEIFTVLANFFRDWLENESDYHPGFEPVCLKLQSILKIP